MDKNEMTFAEIRADKEKFLRQYNVKEAFSKCNVSWETLMEIGDDYEKKCYGSGRDRQEYGGEYFEFIQSCIAKIANFENVHSYRFRIKKTGSLLSKIIKKGTERGGAYSVADYFQKITDLLGVRILYVFKEDYWAVHRQIMETYENQLAQDICIKLKAGDDKEMYERLLRERNNVRVEEDGIYRSIHYTIYAQKTDITACPHIEIQTRTIFEEGWSEINHKLVYKEKKGNQGLKKTSDVLSSMVGACDTIGTVMKMLYDTGVRPDSYERENIVLEESDNVVQVIRNFLRQ